MEKVFGVFIIVHYNFFLKHPKIIERNAFFGRIQKTKT